MKIIGYWAIDKSGYSEEALKWTKDDPEYPSPEEFIDKSWAASYPIEFSSVRNFLSGKSNRINGVNIIKKLYKGSSKCRLCNCINGSEEYQVFYKKKHVYTIPSGYLHYVQSHSVKPPQDFIDFCVSLYT